MPCRIGRMFFAFFCFLVFLLFAVCPGAFSFGANARRSDVLSYVDYQKLDNALPVHGFRSGNASRSHSCSRVRHVPFSLRFYWVFRPSGIQSFYRKYTETYGIPVIGSEDVPDDSLKRACYVLRFLLADHSKIRQSFYRLYGRVAVIGVKENVTDLPDYSRFPPEINHRARGLGPTETVPVVSGAEENLLCHREDPYFGEDILLHEIAHGVHLAVQRELSGWQRRLAESYWKANASRLWSNTYSSTSAEEYVAEGVQSYFGVNSHSDPPDGVHGPVNTAEKLMKYDPDLYHLIALLFPCGNVFLKPCQSNRTAELRQALKMDCDVTEAYAFNMKTFLADRSASHNSAPQRAAAQNVTPSRRPDSSESCSDNHIHCQAWSQTGECQANPAYMSTQCPASCRTCRLLYL